MNLFLFLNIQEAEVNLEVAKHEIEVLEVNEEVFRRRVEVLLIKGKSFSVAGA